MVSLIFAELCDGLTSAARLIVSAREVAPRASYTVRSMNLGAKPLVTILGGGVIGLSCAWELARRGACVQVLERGDWGREASFAAGGMLAPTPETALHGFVDEAMSELCFASLRQYPDFERELRDECSRDIELSLRKSEFHSPEEWREPGILLVSTKAKSPKNVGETRDWNGRRALWLRDEGQVEPRLLVQALRVACENRGVELRSQTEVSRVEIEGERVVAIHTSRERLEVSNLLICAGAWAGEIEGLPPEISPDVRPVLGQMIQLRAEKRVPHIVYGDDCYLVPRRDGRLLVGATVENTGFHKRVTAGGIQQLLGEACELLPELLNATWEDAWAGLRPVSPDGIPTLGPSEIAGLFWAVGHGRNGVLLAPKTARIVANSILQNSPVAPAFGAARWKRVLV